MLDNILPNFLFVLFILFLHVYCVVFRYLNCNFIDQYIVPDLLFVELWKLVRHAFTVVLGVTSIKFEISKV